MAERRVRISLKTSWSWGSGSFAQRRYRQALRAGRHFCIIFDVLPHVRVISPQTFAPRQREQITARARVTLDVPRAEVCEWGHRMRNRLAPAVVPPQPNGTTPC